jgi:HSP20 family molecular chaperone IbpA
MDSFSKMFDGGTKQAVLLGALGGMSIMYFWRAMRTPDVVNELLALVVDIGPSKVVEWLRIEVAKKALDDLPFDDYDLIISLESVRDLGEKSAGCPVIATSEKAVATFEKPITVRAVSVLGLYNTGKTFLQSHLFGFNFPQGPLVRTSGLSMKLLEDFNLLIVDSAGNLEPVSTASPNGSPVLLEEAVKDRRDVELLNKELAFHLSDILIVVVHDITWPEQEFCQGFANRCSLRPRKGLIVVHNMRHITDPVVAATRFNEQVSQVYQGVAVKNINPHAGAGNVLEFIHRDPVTDDLVIHHFGLANQHSVAGQMYNAGAFRQIRAVIDFHDRVGSKRVIKNVIRDQGTLLLPQFFYCDDEGATARMKLEFGKAEAKQGCIGTFYLHQPTKTPVHMRHSGLPAVLTTWDPAMSMTVETSETSLQAEVLHLRIEVPGVSRENVNVKDTEEGLLVTIDKDKMQGDMAHVTMTVEDKRLYSRWRRLFDYKVPGCGAFAAPGPKGVTMDNGILHIIMQRAKTKGAIGLPDGDEDRVIPKSFVDYEDGGPGSGNGSWD